MELCRLSYFLQILFCGLCSAINLSADLKYLAEMLPGYYSNNDRNSKHFRQSFERPVSSKDTPAEALTTIPLNAVYRPVEVTFLPDSFNLYVEQTLHGHSEPHRQWLYSFSRDDRTRSLKLKVYKFVDLSLVDKISKNPRSVKYLTERDVSTRDDCDMLWRRLGDTFIGTTSRQCLADVDGEKVRISVTTTLTHSCLQIDEGWYNVKDGSKVIELDGPILLTKIERIAENPFLEEDYEIGGHEGKKDQALLQKDSQLYHKKTHDKNKIPEGRSRVQSGHYNKDYNNQKSYRSNNIFEDYRPAYSSKDNSYYENAIEKAGFNPYGGESRGDNSRINYGRPDYWSSTNNEPTSTWNIQTYEGVIDALVSGHKVYFTAKTKKCHYDKAPKRERTTLGDYVDIFEIHKDFSEKQPHKYLQFSFRRLQYLDRKGFKEVIKEVTVHRNGSVHIATVMLNENGKIDRHSLAVCELYNQDSGKGEVKFYLDPYRSVSKVIKMKSLRTTLQEGKMVRITAELDKCSGGASDSVIIGGEMRGYDLGRNGKTLDVTLTNTRIMPTFYGELSVEEQHSIFRFSKRGEVTLIRHRKHVTSLVQNGSVVTGYHKYLCEIDPNSSTKAIFIYNA